MKLLAVSSARAIWLVSTLFLNPRGRQIATLFPAIAERYRFSKLPDVGNIATSPLELKFEGGTFVGADGVPIYASLSTHDDGFVAETRTSTDASEAFLEDALTWFSESLNLPHFSQLDIQRLYVSEVIVQLDLPQKMFSDRFGKFLGKLRGGMDGDSGTPFELTSVNFAPDPTTTRKSAGFRVERLAGRAFEGQEFICSAPLRTEEHLGWLGELEKAAG